MKTKLGITVGLMGAAIYFTGLFAGYIPLALLVGYTLLFEDNEWLKKSAVKAFAISIGFSILVALVSFIPSAITLIDNIVRLFGGNSVYISWINNIVNIVKETLYVIEEIVLLMLGFKAFRQSTIKISIIDNLITKYMD